MERARGRIGGGLAPAFTEVSADARSTLPHRRGLLYRLIGEPDDGLARDLVHLAGSGRDELLGLDVYGLDGYLGREVLADERGKICGRHALPDGSP